MAFQSKPCWYLDGKGPTVEYDDGKKTDVGHGVPLGHYGTEEIRKILLAAARVLNNHGTRSSPCFAR